MSCLVADSLSLEARSHLPFRTTSNTFVWLASHKRYPPIQVTSQLSQTLFFPVDNCSRPGHPAFLGLPRLNAEYVSTLTLACVVTFWSALSSAAFELNCCELLRQIYPSLRPTKGRQTCTSPWLRLLFQSESMSSCYYQLTLVASFVAVVWCIADLAPPLPQDHGGDPSRVCRCPDRLALPSPRIRTPRLGPSTQTNH